MIKSIWGFGSLKLRTDTLSVQFPYSMHNLYYEKANYRQTAITGKIHDTDIIYRPMIECTIALCQGDQQKLATLVGILNSTYLYVAPQYSDTNTGNIQYQCLLDSNVVRFDQLSNAQVGQTINLVFIGRYLDSLPTHMSNAQIYNLINELDQTIVDQSGNTIILRTY